MSGELTVPETGTELSPVGSEVGTILQNAVAQGAGVEELRQIVELYKEVRAIEAAAQLSAARSRVQSEIGIVPRTKSVLITPRDGAPYGWNYSPLEVIADHARGPLSAAGLSYYFTSERLDGETWTFCYLEHSSGAKSRHGIKDVEEGRTKQSGSQRAQSAHTYAKRQALSDALGITTEDDDDAEGRKPAQPISEEQNSTLRTYLDELPGELPGLLEWAGVATLAELPSNRYEDAVRALRRKLEKKQNPPEPAE